MTVPSASTGVHRTDEHEITGICHVSGNSGKTHFPVLKGLSEHLKNIGSEFRQFIQKQDSRQPVMEITTNKSQKHELY